MFDRTTRTELQELGEFGLIERIKNVVRIQQDSTVKGIGDDAAVLDFKNARTLISTDLLLEGVHFDLSYSPLKHLGYKAVQVNLSDIYAMNAVASQITYSLGISSKFPLEAVDELMEGALLACQKYNVDLIGGDTSASKQGLVISITSIGYANRSEICYRDGAESGDLIVVTGDLGAAFTGLQLLEREKRIFFENPKIQPDLEGKDYIVERQLKPEARKDVREIFQSVEIKPNAMIDISDGLASDILHICKSSNKGCRLFEEKLPIDQMTFDTAREFGLDPTVCALHGGEDYELLFTIPQSAYDQIKSIPEFSVIGYITDESEGCSLISRGGKLHPLTAQGWNAFKRGD